MANCELCGFEDNLIKTIIEGVSFSVCRKCQGYGKVVEDYRKQDVKKPSFKREDVIEEVVLNYSELIKDKRLKFNLTQKELASKLNEKEAFISKIEAGNIKPNLELARKIGRFFNIKLVSGERISEFVNKKENNWALTIGDFIKK